MLWEIYRIFFKIGGFTFGGGFAMIPIIQQEIVSKKNWIKEEDFLDVIAIAQSSPGPIAVNTSIYVGYKINGFPGALVATLGTVMPSFIIILLIAMFFYQFNENIIIQKIFAGIRPAVVALILSAIYGLIRQSHFNYPQLFIALATALIVAFINVNPIYMIVTGVVISIIINKTRIYISKNKKGN